MHWRVCLVTLEYETCEEQAIFEQRRVELRSRKDGLRETMSVAAGEDTGHQRDKQRKTADGFHLGER